MTAISTIPTKIGILGSRETGKTYFTNKLKTFQDFPALLRGNRAITFTNDYSDSEIDACIVIFRNDSLPSLEEANYLVDLMTHAGKPCILVANNFLGKKRRCNRVTPYEFSAFSEREVFISFLDVILSALV